ncbi:MAG: hypothetical protein M1828_007053 [Chrysothrix sp. TS-e1954]|nr:MAG: hypothetical protein M1828_007053 [Chrysothrix sp. TS-e1954]
MKVSQLIAAIGSAALVSATPCPFHNLQDAASAGKLSARDAAIVDKMARDPSYVPALDPEAAALMKRGAAPEPATKAAPKPNRVEERQLLPQLPSGFPDIGGGLVGGILQPFTGVLSGLDVPTPQEQSLREIPGQDAFGKAHPFQAPGPTDIRGGCPTLNTLANHGILARNGITTFADAANAVQIGYGFGYDLSTVLSALGVIAGGDLISGKYSIGGADSRVPNTLGPSLGLFKHGTFEIDGSITRQDNYDGNESTFELSRWNNLVAMSKQYNDGLFGLPLFTHERAATWDEAKANNPNFNGGVKQFAVSLAERSFVFRGLPNGTTENLSNFENIAPFFLNETFPEAWFRRGDAFGLVNLAPDLVNMYTGAPRPIGSNENGKFVGLPTDPGTTPEDFMCFFLQTVFDTVPGSTQPALLNNLDLFTAFANTVITPLFGQFGCPGLMNFTTAGATANVMPGDSAGGSPINGVYPA